MRINDGGGDKPKEKPLELSISPSSYYHIDEPKLSAPPKTQAPAPAPEPVETPHPVPAEPAPEEPAPVPPQVSPPAPKPTVSQELNAEHSNFQQDLALGKITPETYHSLYAKKDTLGKIGTLFGLVLSGAGSALAHQPDAVLGMMQQEINNDLDAQKASNTNSQNWYQLSLKHELQKAEAEHLYAQAELARGQAGAIPSSIKKTEADTGLITAQTGMVPSQIKKNEAEAFLNKAQATRIPAEIKKLGAEARGLDRETSIKTDAQTANRMTSGAFQYIVDMVNKMPEGPTKEQGKQALGMMYPEYQKLILGRNAQAEGMINYMNMMGGGLNGGQAKNSPINYDRFNALQRLGEKKIPGGMSSQDIGHAHDEATELEKTGALKKSYIDSFKALEKMAFAGKLRPGQRDAYINALGAGIAKQSAGRYNENEATALVKGMFPDVGDLPSTSTVKLRKGMEFFDNQMAGTPTLDRYHLKGEGQAQPPTTVDAAPEPSGKSGQQTPNRSTHAPAKKPSNFQLKDGAIGVDKKSGAHVVWRESDHKWHKVRN